MHMTSEASVHGQLTPKQKHQGSRAWQSEVGQSMVVRRQGREPKSEKKGPRARHSTQGYTSMTHPYTLGSVIYQFIDGSQANQAKNPD